MSPKTISDEDRHNMNILFDCFPKGFFDMVMPSDNFVVMVQPIVMACFAMFDPNMATIKFDFPPYEIALERVKNAMTEEKRMNDLLMQDFMISDADDLFIEPFNSFSDDTNKIVDTSNMNNADKIVDENFVETLNMNSADQMVCENLKFTESDKSCHI